VRREADGTVTVLAARHDGKLLNSPNDVALHNDGTLWFTDPSYGLGKRKKEQVGNFVYRVVPGSGAVAIVQREFDQPNGICFSPDHSRLYIADSGKQQRIGAFPVAKDGTLGDALFWMAGGADGMRCDVLGNLYATARDGVRIFAPSGQLLVTVPMPEAPTNCAFGGAHGTTLFVTCRSRLCRVEVEQQGAAVPPLAPAVEAKAGRADK
jgi:gluconolactonase